MKPSPTIWLPQVIRDRSYKPSHFPNRHQYHRQITFSPQNSIFDNCYIHPFSWNHILDHWSTISQNFLNSSMRKTIQKLSIVFLKTSRMGLSKSDNTRVFQTLKWSEMNYQNTKIKIDDSGLGLQRVVKNWNRVPELRNPFRTEYPVSWYWIN